MTHPPPFISTPQKSFLAAPLNQRKEEGGRGDVCKLRKTIRFKSFSDAQATHDFMFSLRRSLQLIEFCLLSPLLKMRMKAADQIHWKIAP